MFFIIHEKGNVAQVLTSTGLPDEKNVDRMTKGLVPCTKVCTERERERVIHRAIEREREEERAFGLSCVCECV